MFAKYSRRIAVFFMFVLAAILIRLPLFNISKISTDEHTFLNMGYDVAIGNLPYIHLWDNKPPLLFFIMAPIAVLADHHIWVVRLIAALCDATTALLVKSIADQLFGKRAAHWLCAAWCFVALTLTAVGRALMSETIALPLMMGAARLFSPQKPNATACFWGGVLLGAATLVRLLPAFPAAALVVTLVADGVVRRDRQRLQSALLVISGGILAGLAVSLPYAVAGQFDMLVRSAIQAPIAYAHDSSGESFPAMLRHSSRFLVLTLLLGLAGGVCSLFWRASDAGRLREQDVRILAMSAATVLSIAIGQAWQHYLALPMGFASVGVASLLDWTADRLERRIANAALSVIGIVLVTMAGYSAVQRGKAPDVMAQTRALLRERMRPGDSLYLTTDYGLYWLLGKSPPHPIVTHAGNLFRPQVFRVLPYGIRSSGELMRVILSRKPTWIVFDDEDGPRYFNDPEVGRVLLPVLGSEYVVQPSPAHRLIYRLRDTRASPGAIPPLRN